MSTAGSTALPLAVIGSAARRMFTGRLPRGRVLAVFEHGFYLCNDRGELCCIGPEHWPLGPLNVLLAGAVLRWRESGLQPASAWTCDGTLLVVDGGPVFTLAEARLWRPPPLGSWRRDVLARNLAYLAALQTRTGGARTPLQAAPLKSVATAAIEALSSWLMAPRRVAPDPRAARLIGLGPGLTPSGDDFIAGLLLALRHLGATESADRLAAWAVPLAQSWTHAISAAHLRAAAAGEGSELLHQALAMLCGDSRRLATQLQAIDRIGHSSGHDALAGLVCGCHLMLKTRVIVPATEF